MLVMSAVRLAVMDGVLAVMGMRSRWIAVLGGGLFLVSACMARASDPMPGDAVALPSNINVFLYYNELSNAGAFAPVRGGIYGQHTRIAIDFQALRYIHTFTLWGMLAGVQVWEPYTFFPGGQEVGISNIAAPPGLPAGTPAYGPGRAHMTHGGGFGQPNFGAFIFPVNDPRTGTYLVIGPWILPPIGSYKKSASLNYSQNLWTFETDLGFRTTLLGRPTGRNLSIEIWGTAYIYGDNNNAALTSPEVLADHIPNIYTLYNGLTHGQVPDSNPLAPATAVPARLHEQPTEELRVYLPYQFYPPTRATITPGLYQSFGGKQVYTLANGTKVDSGLRTEETQLRLVVSTYLSRHWQVLLNAQYDVAAHGGPLSRAVELRVAAAF